MKTEKFNKKRDKPLLQDFASHQTDEVLELFPGDSQTRFSKALKPWSMWKEQVRIISAISKMKIRKTDAHLLIHSIHTKILHIFIAKPELQLEHN